MGFQHGYARAAGSAFVGGGGTCDACADDENVGLGGCICFRLPCGGLLPCLARRRGLLGDGRGVPNNVFGLREVFVQMAGGVGWQQPQVGFRLPLADVVHGIVHKTAGGFLPCLGKGLLLLVFRLPLGGNAVGGQAEDKVLTIGMGGEVGLDLGKAGDVCPCVDVACHVMVCAVGAHGMFAVCSMHSWE